MDCFSIKLSDDEESSSENEQISSINMKESSSQKESENPKCLNNPKYNEESLNFSINESVKVRILPNFMDFI